MYVLADITVIFNAFFYLRLCLVTDHVYKEQVKFSKDLVGPGLKAPHNIVLNDRASVGSLEGTIIMQFKSKITLVQYNYTVTDPVITTRICRIPHNMDFEAIIYFITNPSWINRIPLVPNFWPLPNDLL